MNGRSRFFASSAPVAEATQKATSASAPRIGALGDTLLHLTFRYNSVAKAKQILAALKKEQVIQMAKTVNHEGKLPIHVIKANPCSTKEKEVLTSLLLPYTLPQAMKNWKNFASVTDLKQEYPYRWSRDLYRNFRVACWATNKARHDIEESSTHPRTNAYDEDEADYINNKVEELRNTIKDTRKRIRKTYAPKGISTLKKEKFIFEKIVKLMEKARVGNCGELGFLGLANVMRMDKEVYAEVYNITNNDHVFVVLGRDPGSNESDFRTWGESAVVCDLWAGDIFPASEIPKKLGVYFEFRYQKKSYNLTGFFNPAFHVLAVQHGYNKKTKLTSTLFEEAPKASLVEPKSEGLKLNHSV